MTEIALADRDPEEIQRRITSTRASLRGKLQQLEDRCSPTQRIRRVRDRINPEAYMGLAALAAISTGACLAIWGSRRSRRTNGDSAMDWSSSLDPAAE